MSDLQEAVFELRAEVLVRLALAEGLRTSLQEVRRDVETQSDADVLAKARRDHSPPWWEWFVRR